MFNDTRFSAALAPIAPPTPVRTAFTKPYWWDSIHTGTKRDEKLRSIVRAFLLGKLEREDEWAAGRHVYTSRKGGTELWLRKNNPSNSFSICIARKIDGVFIGNASSIFMMRQANGKVSWISMTQQKIQRVLSECMPMVPFRMFEENKLDLNTFQLVERAKDEVIEVLRGATPRKEHFMGAMVFSLERKGEGIRSYYLFDIDRGDLKEQVINPFLSRLPRACRSVEDAYDSLMPEEVRTALKEGKAVVRQGEWFFIPVEGNFEIAKVRRPGSGGPPAHAEGVLQSKGNRAHYTKKLSVEGYVKGRVWHGGYEHPAIELSTWHKPVPNAAIESFTVTGGID